MLRATQHIDVNPFSTAGTPWRSDVCWCKCVDSCRPQHQVLCCSWCCQLQGLLLSWRWWVSKVLLVSSPGPRCHTHPHQPRR